MSRSSWADLLDAVEVVLPIGRAVRGHHERGRSGAPSRIAANLGREARSASALADGRSRRCSGPARAALDPLGTPRPARLRPTASRAPRRGSSGRRRAAAGRGAARCPTGTARAVSRRRGRSRRGRRGCAVARSRLRSSIRPQMQDLRDRLRTGCAHEAGAEEVGRLLRAAGTHRRDGRRCRGDGGRVRAVRRARVGRPSGSALGEQAGGRRNPWIDHVVATGIGHRAEPRCRRLRRGGDRGRRELGDAHRDRLLRAGRADRS